MLMFLMFVGASAKSVSEQCHGSVGDLALPFLSTKRPYAPKNTDPELKFPESCEPVKLWVFGRHGTRYPGEDDINSMVEVLPALHAEIVASRDSALCDRDAAYFASWTLGSDLNVSTESFLHTQGWGEVAAIGGRFKSRFPGLFGEQFDNKTHYFRATDSERTVSSLRAFTSSAFPNSSVWFPEPIKNDPVLKFYSSCTKWKEGVDDNPASREELRKFEVSAVMNSTLARVSSTFGLNRNLTLHEITIMYTACGFETAWMNGTASPWCVGFSVMDLGVMAYREDLEYYWVDGFGAMVNWEQACVAVRDAVHFLDEYVSNPGAGGRSVQAYFSHSGATLKILARLGLFNGTRIRSDNFEAVAHSYEWRTSDIDCMGSNIAFAMLHCDKPNSNVVGMLFQEELVPGWGFIDYREFRGRVDPFLDSCDFHRICSV